MIELMIVIAIIAILAVVAIPSLTRAITDSKVSRAMAEFRTIDTAANAIFAHLGVYPAEGAWCVGPGFVNISDVPATYQSFWKGPYLKRWPLQHPFGGCVTYLRGGGCFDSDGIANNEAYVHYMDAGPLTTDIKQAIDKAMDDGNLSTGIVRQCRGGLTYLLGEGPNW